MVDLSHWDFASTFTPSEAAALIIGMEPGSSNEVKTKIKPVLSRMQASYQALLYYHYSQEFPDEENVGTKFPHAPFESEAMFYLSVPIDGNQEKFTEWLASEKDRDFANQIFSARRINEWLQSLNLKSVYSFKDGNRLIEKPDVNSKMDESTLRDQPLATKERNTLLTIIAALCKDAGHDYKKPAKTAGLIQSTAAMMGISVGETTIEGHLKKIPDALAARMK